jgi:probable rRNA maturation factor
MNICLLNIVNDNWLTKVSDWQSVVDECATAAFEAAGWNEPSEVSVVLADDVMVQRLNAQYRNKNEPTNVLSFPLLSFVRPCVLRDISSPDHSDDQPDRQPDELPNKQPAYQPTVYLLGDVILSYSAISRECSALNRSFMNHAFHLITHGILHLLGYDHELASEAFLMESMEIMILQKFNIPNPYEII